MADGSYQPGVYREQGGNRMVVKSGASFDVESGGELDIESGGSLKIAGVAITATAAEINAAAGTGVDSTELGFLDGALAGSAVASKAVIADASGRIADADLILESTNEINVTIGGVGLLALDDSAIASNAAATDTAGKDCYIETQDAGATPTTAKAGGLLSIKSGDGASAADATACGAGGALSLSSGAGGANSGGATGEAGGAGGAVTFSAGAGGTTDSTGAHAGGAGGSVTISSGIGGTQTGAAQTGGAGGAVAITAAAGGATTVAGATGGAGGDVTITAGVGGADGEGASGTGGAGGDIVLVPGDGGAGNTAGAQGLVKFGDNGSWVANATETITISNVGPAGIGTATISKWLLVKDNADAEFYIPVWT